MVAPALLDTHSKQVIILSHVQEIIDRLRDLNIGRSLRIYHFESYHRDGPQIVEQVKLAKMLSTIKSLSAGNEDNRKTAVSQLRVLAECFIRELYLKKVGAPAPVEYAGATAAELLKLSRTIPDISTQECASLADTVKFADPAHHSEVGYAVSQSTAIRPHIDRLEGLIKRHNLL